MNDPYIKQYSLPSSELLTSAYILIARPLVITSRIVIFDRPKRWRTHENHTKDTE